MDNRVYYGEYSLKHWIELILKKNVILPEYQRFFVWNEKKVEKLIDTFKQKQFIPPVTIGAFKNDDESQNLILDGQQRLTSILLAYLGLFPDETEFKKTVETFVNDNDDEEEPDEVMDNIFEWKFDLLTSKGRTKQEINSKIIDGNYKRIDLELDNTFFETHFLGFSYLVPSITDQNDQQKYYSTVFRNINIQGETLLPQESRASLYYLDKDLESFFRPTFIKSYAIKGTSSVTTIDFVRYLSMLSQYSVEQTSHRIARSYKPKMEKYYEEYIYDVVADNEGKYGKFSTIFPQRAFEERLTNLRNTASELDISNEFPSIIDLDMYFFGLIYVLVFENNSINIERKEELMAEVRAQINDFKANSSHTRAPSNLGHLRSRVQSSIEIYCRYAN